MSWQWWLQDNKDSVSFVTGPHYIRGPSSYFTEGGFG